MATPTDRTGVVRDAATGELLIPASQRPDGTWRKARRVKDGYIPQEEVPVYESRGMQFQKSKPDYPIGLCPDDIAKHRSSKAGGNDDDSASKLSKAAKKNAKRKEKRKQKPGENSNANNTNSVVKEVSKLSLDSKPDTKLSNEDIAKKIKNLKKKVRQIEDLEAKIQSGELKNPEKDQLEKIQKKQSILDEIEDYELELDDD